MQVAAGRAEELEGMRPFGLMTGVFGCTRSATDPRRAAIGQLLSGGTGERNPITVTSDPGLRFRVVDALADLVEELALAGPLAIGVDDCSGPTRRACWPRWGAANLRGPHRLLRPSPRSASWTGWPPRWPPGRYLSLGGSARQRTWPRTRWAPGQLLAGLAGAAATRCS